MGGQRGAGHAVAGHDVEHAGGKPASMTNTQPQRAGGVCSAGFNTMGSPRQRRAIFHRHQRGKFTGHLAHDTTLRIE